MRNTYKFLFSFFLISVSFSCEYEEGLTEQSNLSTPFWFDKAYAKTLQFPAIKITEVSPILLSSAQLTGLLIADSEGGNPHWGSQKTHVLWNAIREGGGYMTIGLKPLGGALPDEKNLSVEELNKLKTYTVEFIRRELAEQNGKTFSVKDLNPQNIDVLPHITVKFDNLLVLHKLRELSTVRYIEPFYELLVNSSKIRANATASSSIGCSSLLYTTPFSSQGFNSKVSWHLDAHKVTSAWDLSTGKNVHIGMIDTGISSAQALLSYPKFNSWLSMGRAIYKYSLTSGSLDLLAHGTGVAGVIAAPVNNNGGMTGVAFQSSLTCYRVNDLPWLASDQSVNDFNTALTLLAQNSNIKIINMSVGRFDYRASMEDAVNFAHNNGKLMFCSTGITGENGGVYPAMFGNAMAVTGVKWNASDPNGTNLDAVIVNPTGAYVDFSVYVQDGDHCALTMDKKYSYPESGNGSSQAAATMSGIAALVWSANPNLTRDEVVNVLKGASSYFRFQNLKHAEYGWGVVDALKAVQDALASCQGELCGGGGYNPNACAGITCVTGYVCVDGVCVVDPNYTPPGCPEGCFWGGNSCVCP